MDDRDLLILRYLNEFKNITKTANALFISQPALTKRIKQLEKELDTHLIESSNKGIRLTPTGLEVASFADEVIHGLDGLKRRVREIDNKYSNVVRITAPNIICEYYMPSVVKKINSIHPEIKFAIDTAPSSEVVTNTRNNRYDFGFLRNDFGWDEDGKILMTTNYIVAASMQPFQFQDLPHMSRVAYTTDAYYMKMLDLWWDSNFDTQPKVDVLVNSLNLCRKVVLRGTGFGLLPSVLIPNDPNIHQIILNDKNGEPIQRHTYLIYKKNNMDTFAKNYFLQFLQENKFDQFLQA